MDKKILIIDDEEAIVNMYMAALTDFHIISAKNGKAGLALAQKEKPNLIFLDIIMPEQNGLDVLQTLKENKETKDIPVIMLTNLPKDASGAKAKALGALDYLIKAENEPEDIAKEAKRILG